MKNNGVRFIAEMGIFIALGLVLDFLAGLYSSSIWPMGGSISIAMIPIFIMSFRYGLKGGLLSGLAIGVIQMLWAGSGIVHWIQAFLDYGLAYTLVGIGGIFAGKIAKEANTTAKLYYVNFAVLLGGSLRTVMHVLSGYVYFSDYAPEGLKDLPLAWSIIYNLGYMVPSIIICMVIISIIVYKYNNLVEYVE